MQCQELSKGFVRARRKPEASRLDRNDFLQKPLRELYNFIRALGDPYPNAFLEDDAGNRLLFKNVAFLERALDNVNEGNKENKA
jgi:methionyl-tRNA formyltransferase